MGKRSMQLPVDSEPADLSLDTDPKMNIRVAFVRGKAGESYLLEYALDLNIHPDISIKILTPAKTDTGYVAMAARGISIARRVSAPAGGRYILNE